MDLFAHFSAHTKLPIRLKDVVDHILESKAVDTISIFPADLDTKVILGFVRVYRDVKTGKIQADIYYAKDLPLPMRRIVCCKELLHIADRDLEVAKTREQVDKLIAEIVVPLSLTASIPAVSDHSAILRALCILLPRDALHLLRDEVESGKLTIEAVAALAQLPPDYVSFLFTPIWEKIVESIK